MEQEVEELRKKVAELEEKLDEQQTEERHILTQVPEPRALKKQSYEYVEGWNIVHMKNMNEALEIAQKCGHSQIVLVEANRQKMRTDLSAHLAYVCITCGQQTVFSTSSFCQEEPANYIVNKKFAAIGKSAFASLVNIVQEDNTILTVPQDKKISEKKPTFLFKLESYDDNSAQETEGEEVNPLEVDLPAQVKSEPFIKEEPEDYLDYLEPSISLTEGNTDDDDHNDDSEYEVKKEADGNMQEPQIDVSTITTNTPVLARATVQPNTQVMGGLVTPWPPHLLIKVHPSLFIRTTCSKIMLPPGLYGYKRNNGLQSIMSVKSDSGTFDVIESHYLMNQYEKEKDKNKKVDNIRWNTKVKKTYTSAHRKTPLQIYSQDCKLALANEGVPKEDWDKTIIDRWSSLPAEEKAVYNDRALHPNGKPSEPEVTPGKKEKKKTTSVPLPALKKFASEVAPGLKKKKPYLAKVENRGQLNKHILEKWMLLTDSEQTAYKLLAGMTADSPGMTTDDSSQKASPTQAQTNKTGPSPDSQNKPKVKKEVKDDSDEEYQPRPSKKRRRVEERKVSEEMNEPQGDPLDLEDEDIKKMLEQVKNGKKFSCDKCDFVTVHENSLWKHISSIHEGLRYQCDKCEKSYTDSSALLRHKKTVHYGVVYKCETCDKTFTEAGSLSRHKKNIHSSAN